MKFLLDTNAVSELMKPRPNPGVTGWVEATDEDKIFLSVVSIAELRYGIERMAAGRQRSRLKQWLQDELPLRFEGRILPVEAVIAMHGAERCRSTKRLDVPSKPWMPCWRLQLKRIR
jgi:predicted nucleic acid-binding protein